MYCAHCGNPLEDNHLYCIKCGRKRIIPIKEKKVIVLENNDSSNKSKLNYTFGILLLTLTFLVTLSLTLFGTFDYNDFVSKTYTKTGDYNMISFEGINEKNVEKYLNDFGVTDINKSYHYESIYGVNTKVNTVEGYNYVYKNLDLQDKFSLTFSDGELISTEIKLSFVGDYTSYKNILDNINSMEDVFSLKDVDGDMFKKLYYTTHDKYMDKKIYITNEIYDSTAEFNYFLKLSIHKEVVNYNDLDHIDIYTVDIIQEKK